MLLFKYMYHSVFSTDRSIFTFIFILCVYSYLNLFFLMEQLIRSKYKYPTYHVGGLYSGRYSVLGWLLVVLMQLMQS